MDCSTPTDFAGAFGQLCGLLNERPLNLPQLRVCFSFLDAYAAAHPRTAWPLAIERPDGTRNELATLEELILHMSLDVMPVN